MGRSLGRRLGGTGPFGNERDRVAQSKVKIKTKPKLRTTYSSCRRNGSGISGPGNAWDAVCDEVWGEGIHLETSLNAYFKVWGDVRDEARDELWDEGLILGANWIG